MDRHDVILEFVFASQIDHVPGTFGTLRVTIRTTALLGIFGHCCGVHLSCGVLLAQNVEQSELA